MSLEKLAALSNKYGKDENFVVCGCGNTSLKDENVLYIKGSGTCLATIKAEEFIGMDRAKLSVIWDKKYSDNLAEREKAVAADLISARTDVRSNGPSVETPAHDAIPFKYVVHLHPAVGNGLLCSKKAAEYTEEIFGKAVLFVDECEPGYVLGVKIKEGLEKIKSSTGKYVNIVFVKNNGIFVGADTAEEVEKIYDEIISKISAKTCNVDLADAEFDEEKAVALAPAIRMITYPIVTFACNNEIKKVVASREAFAAVASAFTPEHILCCKAEALFVSASDDIEKQYELLTKAVDGYKAEYGYAPRIIAVEGLGIFAAANCKKCSDTAKAMFIDAVKIAAYAEAFGGACFMDAKYIDFIKNWNTADYRLNACCKGKRASEKVIIVTGSAQGFGQGVAMELLAEGANIIVADLNTEMAEKNAEAMCAEFGKGKALAVTVNVANEESVKAMINKTVLNYGGVDVFINNAGIVRAGSLDEMTVSSFDLVTNVNYTAYFLGAKYTSKVMKIQNRFNPEYYMDIIQINSKSGLSGSNKNFAYAGSKFGGIGLTQSFALELVPFNIKVNSVCPGNFLDGPLWCDPEKGLFKQYLDAGKVPGSKTVADVKKFYEAKVPMNRGCRVVDVANAIFYCMEQQYETGQAIPVTGGQNMLK